MYKHFSNYIHGNVLSKDDYGNEKFWIISEVINLSGQMVELVSIKILDNSRKKEISEWIKRVSKNTPEFIKLWNSKKEKIARERSN